MSYNRNINHKQLVTLLTKPKRKKERKKERKKAWNNMIDM